MSCIDIFSTMLTWRMVTVHTASGKLLVTYCFALSVSCAIFGCGAKGRRPGPVTVTPRYGWCEVFNRRPAAQGEDWELQRLGRKFNQNLVVKPLDPFTVIV